MSRGRRRGVRQGLDAIFRPRGVAVIGASRREGAIGRQVVANLVAGGFSGPVYPVNASSSVVLSMPSYKSVADIPGPVDLAVLCVPAEAVLDAAKACAKKGVGGLVVITAGFKEIGGEGAEREDALVALCAEHGIRIIGPNCMGVINNEPAVQLDASFASTRTPPGGVAMVSQSGALGEAILSDAANAGIGVSMFASVGNRADVTAADLIEYWEHCEEVKVILLYVESLGDPAHFVEVARRVARRKPILAVKSGRSVAGAEAAGSHTGSVAGADVAADTLFRQCGVIRVESFREMFALTAALLHQPVPHGRRVAVVTNAGGPGILATDALDNCGLVMTEFKPRTNAALTKGLPPEASIHNPVDLIASADAERYRRALKAVAKDPNVDALVVLFVSPIMIDAVAVAEAIVEQAPSDKPVFVCLMGRQRGPEALQHLKDSGIPVFRYPEDVARTLRSLVQRGEWLCREVVAPTKFRVQKRKAAAILDESESGWLEAQQAELVLAAYGVPFTKSIRVSEPGEAVAAAHKLGFPVVLKAEGEGLLHKSDMRAVITGLRTGDAVFAAAQDLRKRLGKKVPDLSLLVQSAARGHREILLGVTRDPRYGPLFAAGLGGTLVEVLRDVQFRIAPMDANDPADMFASLNGAPLLDAYRGDPACDVDLASEILLRLQQLVLDFPRITEVEINPFILASVDGESLAVDARLHLSD